MRVRAGRPQLRVRDALSEAIASLYVRPIRTVLTALGTILGVTSLVATIGLSQTASNQIQTRFDAVTATRITIQLPSSQGAVIDESAELPWDAEQRLIRLNGVTAAAATADIKTDLLVSSTRLRDPTNLTDLQLPIRATTPGLAQAAGLSLRSGRFIDHGDMTRIDNVAVLGASAATELHITRLTTRPAIYIGDDPYTVIGILTPDPTVDAAILLPATTAEHRYKTPSPTDITITTALGATQLIARQAPIALNPNHPDRLIVLTPPSPDALRSTVRTDINSLFLALAGLALLISTIGIANVTLVNVLERQPELALRRALGASPTHIATHVLLEATLTGLAGGLTGTTLGTITITITAAARQWTPTLDPKLPIAAPLTGLICGLLAGIWPAHRAASTEPTSSLR